MQEVQQYNNSTKKTFWGWFYSEIRAPLEPKEGSHFSRPIASDLWMSLAELWHTGALCASSGRWEVQQQPSTEGRISFNTTRTSNTPVLV